MEAYQNIPVLVLTSEEETGLEQELLTVGANDYVLKTSSVKLILARIQKLMRGTKYPQMELTLE